MILVTRFSALGDIAMTVPALYDACLANPSEQFLMLTRKGPASLFLDPPANLEVEGIDLGLYKGAAGLWRLASEMVARGVTLYVDLHDVLRTKILRRFLQLRGVRCVTIRKGRAEKKRLVNHTSPLQPLTPGVERYRDTFRRAGLAMKERFQGYFTHGADPSLYSAATPPRRPGEKWIGVAPFARHQGKIYPVGMMETLLEQLTSRQDVKVFLFAGGPEEEAQAARWADKFPRLVSLAPLKLGFKGEMALMSECETVLSMDSANMHLASLAPARVVSVWGATHPYCGFMGWRQQPGDALQLDMECRPCSVYGNRPCHRGDYQCMRGITPGSILKKMALSLLLATGLMSVSPVTQAASRRSALSPWNSSVRTEAPWSADASLAIVERADRAYDAGEYAEAIALYRQAIPTRLPLSERAGYYFRLASSLARLGLMEEAEEAAAMIAPQENGEGPASFMEGYIAYRKRDFATAREAFSRAPEEYHPEIYIAQIELSEGNYRRAAELALPLLDERLPRQEEMEMLRVAGIASFRTGDLPEAAALLEKYMEQTGEPAEDVVYTLGDIEYRRGNTERARELLQTLASSEDPVAQGAQYTLGQIAASSDNSKEAALAFSQSARRNYDPNIGEKALYNYITSSTQGATVPFSSVASLYETYLKDYSNSDVEHNNQLNRRFAQEYYREHNYAQALACIDRIVGRDPEVSLERQKILYELGRQELIDRQYGEAVSHLRQGVGMRGPDKEIVAETELLLGDALYAQDDFWGASQAYSSAAASLKGANRTLALYNDAYALYNQDLFTKAAKRFEQAIKATPALDSRQLDDARLRLADCQFYNGKFGLALKGYSEMAASGNDYAAFRQAVAEGLTGSVERKITMLGNFSNRFPQSRWESDVLLELGNTYAGLDRTREAEETYSRLARLHPSSPQARKGTLARALALAKAGDSAGAAQAYRQVISTWPASEEAELANADMRRLAASEGTLPEYAAFLRGVKGGPKLDDDQIETLTFEAAESAYSDNISDIARLQAYLKNYPDGRYLAQALLDLAQAARESGNAPLAVEYADRIEASRPDAPQAVEALLLKGEVIEESLPARKGEALAAYRQLELRGGSLFFPESYSGIMRTTDDASERLKYARLVKSTGAQEADAIAEAELYEGIALLHQSAASRKEGIALLRKLAAQPETMPGARAAVELGEWFLDQGRTPEATEVLTAFTDAGTPQAYWLARGFIALSDAYRKSGQVSLAKEYLRSLKENYPGREPDIHKAIDARLK